MQDMARRRSCYLKRTTILTATLIMLESALWAQTGVPGSGPAGPSVVKLRYVHKGGIWPELREPLKLLGDRLERPGKERLILTGALSLQSYPQSIQMRMIWEYPGRFRLDQQAGAQNSAITFDGTQVRRTAGSLSDASVGLIETLLFDSAEHFFIGQMEGLATRCLGNYARTDDGQATDYTGPYYDIYLVSDQVSTRSSNREQLKLFYFNSQTYLLERIKYQLKQGDEPMNVEIRISDWNAVGDQLVPRSITRLENDSPVMTLVIASATVGPQADDSIFATP